MRSTALQRCPSEAHSRKAELKFCSTSSHDKHLWFPVIGNEQALLIHERSMISAELTYIICSNMN